MRYQTTIAQQNYIFPDLKTLMAKASPLRSGDELAGIAAQNATERVAAQMALAEVPLKKFLNEVLVDYETDEVTRLIIDEHDAQSFYPIAHFTVGDFRNWLLSAEATTEKLQALSPGLIPEMVAAVSKIMRNQDLILVASKCEIITRFRNTVGLKGRLSPVYNRTILQMTCSVFQLVSWMDSCTAMVMQSLELILRLTIYRIFLNF